MNYFFNGINISDLIKENNVMNIYLRIIEYFVEHSDLTVIDIENGILVFNHNDCTEINISFDEEYLNLTINIEIERDLYYKEDKKTEMSFGVNYFLANYKDILSKMIED